MDASTEGLISQTERLEAENRRLKMALAGLALVAGAGILAAAVLPMRRRYRIPNLRVSDQLRDFMGGAQPGRRLQAAADVLRFSRPKKRMTWFG